MTAGFGGFGYGASGGQDVLTLMRIAEHAKNGRVMIGSMKKSEMMRTGLISKLLSTFKLV